MSFALALALVLGAAAAQRATIPAATPPPDLSQASLADPADPRGALDEEESKFAIYWDQGLHIEALRESFTLRTAGSVQNDSAAFSVADEETEIRIENGVQWRRARVFAEGAFARHFNYKLQYDFAVNNPPHLKDAYLGFDVPVFPLRMRGGRFRAPLGLEGHTSGMDTTFMERGLISAFLPSRNTGALFTTDASRRAHDYRAAVAVIKPEDDFGIGSTDRLGVSARASYAFHPTDHILLHVGGDYMHRTVDETIRFLSRPESQIAPPFVDTGDMVAGSVDTGMFELAVARGPLSVQTEGAFTWVDRGTEGLQDPFFWGGYGFVSYVISGESRPYQGDRGNFGRLHPDGPFFGPDGSSYGAFEVAFRVSYLDLEDKEIAGGRLLDLTLGLNWHATRNARVLGNIIWANQITIDESTWIAQIRLQWAY